MVYDAQAGLVMQGDCVNQTFEKTTAKYKKQGIEANQYEELHGKNKMWSDHKKDRTGMSRWSML